MYIAIIINQLTRRVWVAIDFDLLVRGYWLGPLWLNRFIIKSKTPRAPHGPRVQLQVGVIQLKIACTEKP